jgi:hypothetical protein
MDYESNNERAGMDAKRQLDANEQFVWDNAHSTILLADSTGTKFEFCPIADAIPKDIEEKIIAKGLRFAGLIGVGRDGNPRTRLTVALDADVLDRLATVFVRGVRARCIDPLERLWLLDPREAAACL